MSESNHTPGKWREGISSGAIVTDCPGPDATKCRDCNEGGAAFYGGHLVCESAREKDRTIIASAPDLLAALEGAPVPPLITVPEHLDYQVAYQRWYFDVRAAALAKARVGKP